MTEKVRSYLKAGTHINTAPISKISNSHKPLLSHLPCNFYLNIYIKSARVYGHIKNGLFIAAAVTLMAATIFGILAKEALRSSLSRQTLLRRDSLVRLTEVSYASFLTAVEMLRRYTGLVTLPAVSTRWVPSLVMSVAALWFVYSYASMDVLAPPTFEQTLSIEAETHTVIEAGLIENKAPEMPELKTASLAPTLLNEDMKKASLMDEASENRNLFKRTKKPLPFNITRGGKDKLEVSVTFDGGSNAMEAEEILNALREREIKTTIFLTGTFIINYPELVRQMVRDGHEIGNHTMTHPHLTEFEKNFRHTTLPDVTEEFLVGELRETEEAYLELTGARMLPLWRAPYGEINKEIVEWAYKHGYLHVGWTADYKRGESLDTLDWVHDRSSRFYFSSLEIKENVLNFGKGKNGLSGGIILMHLGTERTEDRASSLLGEILDGLTEMGYRFVKVSTLIEGKEVFEDLRVKSGRLAMGMDQ
jgi:peptidoglycan/xylan/chitin deacetylase (PgdA/CDA1 family)